MNSKIIHSLIFFLILMSCSKDGTNPDSNSYTVTGKISNENGPISGASVSIDKKLNWTVKSSTSGEFRIDNVSEGEHNLSVSKTENDDSFIEQNENLAVYSNVNLDLIKLPLPVKMHEALNITVSDISLSWDSTDAEDFREYKIYRNDSPGLDEITGELIFVSTGRSEVSFTDTGLISNKTYYYRVYVMNEFGRIGGSNIVNATTRIGNLIPDGGFENTDGINLYWNITWGEASFSYNDSTKVSGNYSLYGQIPEAVTLSGNTTISLSKDVTYELSGWFKAKGHFSPTNETISVIISNNSKGFNKSISIWAPIGVDSVDIGWTHETNIFTPTEDIIVDFELWSGFENIWVDDLSLKAQ